MITKMQVKIDWNEPMLATSPANETLMADYIASKAPTTENANEEIKATPEDLLNKSKSVFARNEDGSLFLWDYQWKGYFKEVVGIMIELGDEKELSKWTYKRCLDCALFISPRRIPLLRGGKPIMAPDQDLQRPMLVDTMQGQRSCIGNSECVRPPVNCEFEVSILESENGKSKWRALDEDLIRACLDYGKLRGFSQWRNAGYGRFEWSESK